jgi:GxxExxY protein
MNNKIENILTSHVIGCAIDIHKALGPGLLESVYEVSLAYELEEVGFHVKRQVSIPVRYKEIKHDVGFRADLVVEDKLIIEIKSVENLAPVHYAQTLTYLKLSGMKLALLINFNNVILKNGIHRIVNNL